MAKLLAVSAVLVAAVNLLQTGAGQKNKTPKRSSQPTRVQRGREFLGLGPAADPIAAERGQKLFVQNCGFCHGSNATGAEGPDLLRSTLVLHDEKGELLGPFLRKGRPEKGMPAFAGLADAQVYDIAEFLHARVEAAANRFGYKVLNVATGDARAGEQFFETKGHCTECHSISGDLAHIASKLEPADLQAQFLYPNGSNSATAPPVMVTVTLPSGEAITGRLKYIDDFEVSLYDSSGNYRSWSRDGAKVEIKDPLAAHRDLLEHYTDRDMHNLLTYLATLK